MAHRGRRIRIQLPCAFAVIRRPHRHVAGEIRGEYPFVVGAESRADGDVTVETEAAHLAAISVPQHYREVAPARDQLSVVRVTHAKHAGAMCTPAFHLPAFLRQFAGAQLNTTDADEKLSKAIDGITGATLSVDAMRRMAQAALVVNRVAS